MATIEHSQDTSTPSSDTQKNTRTLYSKLVLETITQELPTSPSPTKLLLLEETSINLRLISPPINSDIDTIPITSIASSTTDTTSSEPWESYYTNFPDTSYPSPNNNNKNNNINKPKYVTIDAVFPPGPVTFPYREKEAGDLSRSAKLGIGIGGGITGILVVVLWAVMVVSGRRRRRVVAMRMRDRRGQ